jgi:carbon-monoxide dehydrogenase medium subunit
MKPAPFEYLRARSVEEALAGLAAHGPEAKLLAGGQSLVPMLNFRLLEPKALVDINAIAGLDQIREEAGAVRIGALARHRAVETSLLIAARLPVLAASMAHVAHFAIRNRGTFGGSLAHADPAAEIPLVARLLDARIRTASPSGGRTIAARDFFLSALTTCLAPDEIIMEVELPCSPPGAGWAFEEVSRRPGDFAVAMVAAVVSVEAGRVTQARLALGGVAMTPIRAEAAETLLAGQALSPDVIAAAAAAAARDAADPPSDLHGSADYRRHLVEVLTRRALAAAAGRATGAAK